MASLAVAVRHGFEMKNALEYADKTYVDVDIFKDDKKADELKHLPSSCWESAESLEKQKDILLKYGVFTEGILNGIIEYHKSYNDKNLRKEIEDNPEKVIKLVDKYFHCG